MAINFTLYFGVEGLHRPIALPPNARMVFPEFKQQFKKEENKFNPELEEFFKEADKVILVSFGTLKKP